MIAIKEKYRGKKFTGKTYEMPIWDEIYLNGRSGEDVMEYDYTRTIIVNYNRQGLAMGERDWRG